MVSLVLPVCHPLTREERVMTLTVTDTTRAVINKADDEAARLHHASVRVEHLLLGIMAHGANVGVALLTSYGLTLEMLRAKVEESLPPGSTPSPRHIPLDGYARAASGELARAEARRLGHHAIEPHHLLLAIANPSNGYDAAGILRYAGLRFSDLYEAVVRNTGIGSQAAAATAEEVEELKAALRRSQQLTETIGRLLYCSPQQLRDVRAALGFGLRVGEDG